MRAIILAAGVGRRLEDHGDRPKCLLEFGGHSLLERHVRILKNLGVTDLTLCVGYRHELIDAVLGNQAYAGVTTVVAASSASSPSTARSRALPGCSLEAAKLYHI